MRKYMGLLVVLLAAFGFLVVYDTVFWSFNLDQYVFTPSLGKWGTPSNALETILRLTAIVLIAWLAVSTVQEKRGLPRRFSPWLSVLLAAIFFSVLYWWLDPIIMYLSHGNEKFFTADTWVDRWYRFGKDDFLAFVPASLLIIGAERLRRWMPDKPEELEPIAFNPPTNVSWRQRWILRITTTRIPYWFYHKVR